MKVEKYINLLNEKVAVVAPISAASKSFLSDEQITLNKKYGIGKSFKKFQSNLINVLKKFTTENKHLFEGRNDIKLIILASTLDVPESFETLKITEKNKSRLVRYLIGKESAIKLKKKTKFNNIINSAIVKTFKKSVLNELVIGDLRTAYYNISNRIKQEIINNGNKLIGADLRSFKTNIEKKLAEALSIKNIVPNTSTKPEVSGGTYYVPHPNGVGRFPDFIIHFGTVHNEDAKKIIKDFGIDTSKVFVESKVFSRKVGKQTRPERFKKDLNDDVLFAKLTSIKVKQKGPDFTGKEIKKFLVVSDIDLDIPVIYLNLLGKTKRTKAKSLSTEIKDNDIFQSKRTSPGQVGFFRDGKKEFGFEIGSIAYKKGLFKEDVKKHVQA